jgi:hypothetical protein
MGLVPDSGVLIATTLFTAARRFTEGIFEASRQDLPDIEHVTPERFSRAWHLRLRYRDKPQFSFAHLTSFVVIGSSAARRGRCGSDLCTRPLY